MRKIHNTGHQLSLYANYETSVSLGWRYQLAKMSFISAGVIYVPWIQYSKAEADAWMQSVCRHRMPPISKDNSHP